MADGTNGAADRRRRAAGAAPGRFRHPSRGPKMTHLAPLSE
jgi:hypothetical protein